MEKLFKKLGIKTNPNKVFTIFFYAISAIFIITRLGAAANILLGDPELKNLVSPFIYALALAAPCVGFCYFVNSGMVKLDTQKVSMFLVTYVMFFMTLCAFAIEAMNEWGWRLLKSFDAYGAVRSTYPQYFDQAFKALVILVPIVGFFIIVDWIMGMLRDDDRLKGIKGFNGLTFSFETKDSGPFTCEVMICRDKDTSIPVIIPEKKRFEATFVQGATGSGKTATVLLPMSAMDLEKKYFFREYSKKTAYGLLKRGAAYVQGPFSNDYINKNFDLKLIKPKKGREDECMEELKNVILGADPETGEISYKNLGIAIVENDGKYISDFTKVAENFDIDVLTVDPMNPETLSINPFAIPEPPKVASIIADVLKSMNEADGGKGDQFFTSVTTDAFQNLAMLLKEMYPRLNNGILPTLEDMLELLYNFDKVEEMVEEMKKIPDLVAKYQLLINYFERNFYKPALNINGFEIPGTRGSGRKETERFLYGAITQLSNLLRHPGIKRSLCGRDNNVDFDKTLKEGYVVTACSRKGELGIIQSKAFGMFFILQFQDAVLRRPGNEDSRIPYFLYIDEFPEYINKDTDVMFTLFRKYRCGVTIAIQNLSQLEKQAQYAYYRQTVLANTRTQIIFGDTVPEDSKYWNEAFGKYNAQKTEKRYDADDEGYDVTKKVSYKMDDKERFKVHKIAEMGFRTVIYKTKNLKGSTIFGEGKTNFLDSKYKNKQPMANYNFEKYMLTKPAVSSYNIMNDSDEDNFFGTTPIDTDASSDASVPAQVATFNDDLVAQKTNFEIPDDFDIVIDHGNTNTEPKLPNATADGAVFEVESKPLENPNSAFGETTGIKKW
ncbi:MAG: TraM recognition domain-containing protein [Clostridia bacterium]